VATALVVDMMVLGAFIWVKASSDVFIVVLTIVAMLLILAGEHVFLKVKDLSED
jgi:hypothetical protein